VGVAEEPFKLVEKRSRVVREEAVKVFCRGSAEAKIDEVRLLLGSGETNSVATKLNAHLSPPIGELRSFSAEPWGVRITRPFSEFSRANRAALDCAIREAPSDISSRCVERNGFAGFIV
jgi:hypothetical protein